MFEILKDVKTWGLGDVGLADMGWILGDVCFVNGGSLVDVRAFLGFSIISKR